MVVWATYPPGGIKERVTVFFADVADAAMAREIKRRVEKMVFIIVHLNIPQRWGL